MLNATTKHSLTTAIYVTCLPRSFSLPLGAAVQTSDEVGHWLITTPGLLLVECSLSRSTFAALKEAVVLHIFIDLVTVEVRSHTIHVVFVILFLLSLFIL